MSDHSKRQEIGSILKQELDNARAAHLAASARFDLLISEAPGALIQPDGSFRIQQAGNEARSALQRYMAALKRFSDFTVSGIVPEDVFPAE